jgi:hypothetical protein
MKLGMLHTPTHLFRFHPKVLSLDETLTCPGFESAMIQLHTGCVLVRIPRPGAHVVMCLNDSDVHLNKDNYREPLFTSIKNNIKGWSRDGRGKKYTHKNLWGSSHPLYISSLLSRLSCTCWCQLPYGETGSYFCFSMLVLFILRVFLTLNLCMWKKLLLWFVRGIVSCLLYVAGSLFNFIQLYLILVTIPFFLLPSGQSRQFISFSNIPSGMVCSFNSQLHCNWLKLQCTE